MFGFVHPNRRLDSIIRALADLRLAHDFQFDIYGTLWDKTSVESLIARAGLDDRVRIHGFASEMELDDAIASAHLAFNLRHPTMGEASGGILRSWAQATPALVTDADWYADLPDDVVLKLSVENEIEGIRRALVQLSERPRDFEKMGLVARLWLERTHSPDQYAAGLAAAMADLPTLMTRFVGKRMLRRVATTSSSKGECQLLFERAVNVIPTLFG
jgi:glycosyltransferase involved in cell wall biosynthesis